MSKKNIRPGLTLGMYPQRLDTWPGMLETQARRGVAKFKHLVTRRKYTQKYIVNKVNRFEHAINKFSDQAMEEHIHQLCRRLHQLGLQNDDLVAQSFATIREVAHRTLGKRHFDVQLLGGWVMMNSMIAEMETGQGKTLTAALPACTAALAGVPVHVVTANDYLAARDEEILRPLYQQMGISSASVVEGMTNAHRKQAYQCDIVHSTSQQITFDYLRDRIKMGNDIGKLQIQFRHIQSRQKHQTSTFLLRGLCFTIIDEADSLLIDEAKTPLIISQQQQSGEQNQTYFDALYLATALKNSSNFIIDEQHQDITLTQTGKKILADLAKPLNKHWQQRRHREIMVTLALKAKYLFHRDHHYLIRNNKVEIIDSLTGRAMPDRSWEHGLHQLIEAKENCQITSERDPLAKISYQKFFKRYLRLAGMSGTVTEVGKELHNVYDLQVIKIPTHKPSRRKNFPEKVFKNKDQKWQAFIKRIKQIHKQGRPILIGTPSVASSITVSTILTKYGFPHQILNAHQDQQEAEIIAKAGQLNNITVATNMAGRGTDIALAEDVKALGGLHVISTERNDARRIDRQLYGRCARQGDTGSTEAFMSLQDENLTAFYPAAILKFIERYCQDNIPLPNWLGKIILTLPQKWIEHKHYHLRCLLIKKDKCQAIALSFTGRIE